VFDFRYHVVSLAAVFIALLFGILIGVGISGRGVLDEAERRTLDERITQLRAQLDAAQARTADQRAAEEYVDETYELIMRDRLAGRNIALVFVGGSDSTIQGAVSETISRAGGRHVPMRSLRVPVDAEQLLAAIEADEELEALVAGNDLASVGRSLGSELVAGGETPLWNALNRLLVTEVGGPSVAVDGVVVARTAGDGADEEATTTFLEGLYRGLASTVPAVAVEPAGRTPSLIDTFRQTSLSSVDNVDRAVGRVSLAVLLAGGPSGHYGFRDGAVLLPPIEPVPPPEDDE
jgi:hypothetical protein